MDTFTKAYIEAALWSSCDDNDEPLDKKYSQANIDPMTLDKMQSDCAAFQKEHGHLFENEETKAGHDFWLTRNSHGAGFWDGDWEEITGRQLTLASYRAGTFDLYVGDDGKLYGYPTV